MSSPDVVRVFTPLLLGPFCPVVRPHPYALFAPALQHRTPRGPGHIAGTVTVEGAPGSRPVRVYDRTTGELMAAVTSAPDGSYRADRLSPDREYLVLAYDDTNIHNAAPADRITPATGED